MVFVKTKTLIVHCFNVACILIYGNTKISVLIHIGRSAQLLIEHFIHNQRHSLELVSINVAVEKPKAWIIFDTKLITTYIVPSSRNHYRVFTDRLTIDAKVWFATPDRFCAQSRATSLTYSTVHIFACNVSVELLNKVIWYLHG